MWYHYQIYNKFSNEVKAESGEQFESPKEAVNGGIAAMTLMELSTVVYKARPITAKEYFLVKLKNSLIRFNPERAHELITNILDYVDCGGKLDSSEERLVSSLKIRLSRFHENYIYETSTR